MASRNVKISFRLDGCHLCIGFPGPGPGRSVVQSLLEILNLLAICGQLVLVLFTDPGLQMLHFNLQLKIVLASRVVRNCYFLSNRFDEPVGHTLLLQIPPEL